MRKSVIIYAREDTEFLEKLERHLVPLRGRGLINPWYDREIPPGIDWEVRLWAEVKSADIILLLISLDFLAFDICRSEMEYALELHQSGSTRSLPVLLRHVSWEGLPVPAINAVPGDGRPVTRWKDQDEAVVEADQPDFEASTPSIATPSSS